MWAHAYSIPTKSREKEQAKPNRTESTALAAVYDVAF